MTKQPHIVVIGGGFGGLNVVQALRQAPVQITLVDRHNYHLFRPLLYQVAMAGLSPGDIASPLRAIFKDDGHVRTLLAEVVDIDVEQHQVRFANGESVHYDKLVVATGAVYDYFGHDAQKGYAPSLETVESALAIRRQLLAAYEAAELEADAAQRQAWMTFAIVGGGPTGVELAGAIGEFAHYTLHNNFRYIDPAQTQILLIEALDQILTGFPPDLAQKAKRSLEKLGVTVRTGVKVTELSPNYITVQTGNKTEQIPCHTIMWAAGTKASAVGQVLHTRAGAPLDRKGRVNVQPDLSLPNHPDIFAIGDLTYVEQAGKPLPGLAPVAIQQGKHVAHQILRQLAQQPTEPFHYVDRGIMATIGRASAVAVVKGLHLSGYIAWLAWLFIHVLNLIGFRNRLAVLSDWVWNYFTYARAARLIVGQGQANQTAEKTASGDGVAKNATKNAAIKQDGASHERTQPHKDTPA